MSSADLAHAAALHTLYSDHHHWLTGWLRRRLGCPQNAADLAQDTFVKVLVSRQAVRIDPNLAVGYQVLSFGLAVQGDYAGGLQAARRAVELNPNDPDSMMALAKAQVRFGDYDEAVVNAERARQDSPARTEHLAWLDRLIGRQRELAEEQAA